MNSQKSVKNGHSKTSDALNDLFKLLKCSECTKLFEDPIYLGNCDHVFCRKCVSQKNSCPRCKTSFCLKDVQNARDLAESLNLFLKLQNHLTGAEPTLSIDGESSIQTATKSSVNAPMKETRKTSVGSTTKSVKSAKKAVNLEKRNKKGETPLHAAVIKNKVADAKAYLQDGADCNVKDFAGWTPLHEACNNGNYEMVSLLLDHGALLNTPGYENNTPLHEAVQCCRLDVVQLLISNGADVHVRNSNGKTPVDFAILSDIKDTLISANKNDVINISIGQTSTKADEIENKNIAILYSGIDQKEISLVEKCADILGARIVNDFSPDVTHLICGCNEQNVCPRTLKYMQCLLTAKWILNISWIKSCIASGSHENDEDFEVSGTTKHIDSNAPKRSRLNASKQFPCLFDGCSFYFHGSFSGSPMSKNELVSLVKMGGGQVLNRHPKPDLSEKISFPFHVDPNSKVSSGCYIIHHQPIKAPKDPNSSVLSLPVSWLLDCISSFAIVDAPI